MAQAQNPKIEELRFRLKTDPKSRLFYPLAEAVELPERIPFALEQRFYKMPLSRQCAVSTRKVQS